MAIKRIGILTGGGDVPGLNSVIKGVVYRGSEHDIEVVGIRRGWEGLTHVNLEDFSSTQRYILPLNRENTRTIDRTGGTFLHSSRTNPSKMKSVPDFLNADDYSKAEVTKSGSTFMAYDLSKKVLKTLEDLRLDYLVCIGGDDTLTFCGAPPRTRLQSDRDPQDDG
ncbi:MAG: 6-phosphofructokinase [Bryobacterales bacterium]|nr:6-phosphofructokinase [Bryobacterales bacterium]